IGGGSAISPSSVSFDLASKTATFNFPAGALANGVWRATLPAGAVNDAEGNLTTSPYVFDFVLVNSSGNFSLPSGATKVNQVMIGGGGKLNVGTSTLLVDYLAGSSPLATISGQIASGRNGGSWNGNGIVTSSATSLTTLAVGEASQVLGIAGAQTAVFAG